MQTAIKTSTPKDLARAARLGIEMARALTTYLRDLELLGEDVATLRYEVRTAASAIMRESIIIPGIRIAVFPIDEQEPK